MNRETAVPRAGVVVAVRGSVVDIRFDGGLPAIHSLLRAGVGGRVAIEVLAQRDARHVRGVARSPTQGLARGMWGQPTQRAIGKVTPQALAGHDFAAGSMGPKVEAARAFVLGTGHRAVIGSLDRIEELIAGTAGTQVCTEAAGGADTL